MASSEQEYFILRKDVPIAKTNNFLRDWLNSLKADHVLRGELLVKEAQPQPHDGSHGLYSLALDKSKKVSCSNYEVVPLSEDDFEWLVAIQKPTDRHQVYAQRDKFEAVQKMQIGDKVWVSLPVSEGTPSQLPGSSCCHATVQFIGPIQDMPGRWAGVELKENRGSSDGSFRDSRYFMCEKEYGAFLPANHILSVSATSAPPAPIADHKKLLLSAETSATDREFYLDDHVVVFDKDGDRVTGLVKWASPGVLLGLNCHIIGIETDKLMKKEKVAEHISRMGYLFSKHDYKKHTYLAVPETSLLKEGDGTPVDSETMDTSNYPGITDSVRVVAADIALESKHSTNQVIKEQAKAVQECEAKKEKAVNEKLAKSLGITPGEVKAQQEQYRKLQRQQSENEQRREAYPGTVRSGATGDDQHHIASGEGSEMIHEYRRSPGVNRRQPPPYERQTSEERKAAQPIPPHLVLDNLEVGTAVELVDPPGYGTIRWIGKFPGVDQDIAGVEMEARVDGSGDGSWKGERYFTCRDGHGVFIVLSKLIADPRFVQQPQGTNPVAGALKGKEQKVELADAPAVDKLKLDHFIGRMRGIQGHQNSCYLDATVFAMFGLTNRFDQVLYEQPTDVTAEDVLHTMCAEIIFPLRSNGVVRYDPVMKLRNALDKLNKVKGLTHAEQDPEEFLNLLFKHVLDLKDPFIQLKRPSGVDTEFFFQLFLEPSEKKKWTVGEMLQKSMVEQQITFAQVPERLIIQLPRYGKAYKVFETVYPELELDVSLLCFDYVPPGARCAVCGKNPTHRCHKCGVKDPNFQSGITVFFCESCVMSAHEHPDRQGHNYEAIGSQPTSEKVTLELMSVVCIEKSHYVCFTRFEDNWVFFDSMADRTDDQYNIPEITLCPAVGDALKHIDTVMEKDVSALHPLVRRLVKDASICFYAGPHASMY